MKIRPNLEQFMEWSRSFERIPVSGEKSVQNFNSLHFFRSLYRNSPNAFLFESGNGPEATARYTLMGHSNSQTLQADSDQITISHNGTRETMNLSPDAVLNLLEFEAHDTPFDHTPHFWGGWVGTITYEMAQWLDAVNFRSKEDLHIPLIYFFQVDHLWIFDHKIGVLKMVVSEKCTGDPQNYYSKTVKEIESLWRKAESILNSFPESVRPSPAAAHPDNGSNLRPNISKEQYIQMVQRTKRYIEEGDIYQANLAQRFEAEFKGDPIDLYENLIKLNPSPFSGYLTLGNIKLISSSPERLVRIEKNVLETRPIAGTRPRGINPQEDDHLKAELLLNEKERAEHLMLVDLERNDMGRICQFGSVRVTDQMFVEQYSHVSHIVSNIQGIIRPGITLKDMLKAVFPGGTITGCPKIRCMEIIDELEPVRRGPYSGSFGYIGFADYLDLNIVIRTILLKDKTAYFHVGAGIVADSIPEQEYQETLDKAAAMINALTSNRKT
ncbi:MAG: anthranilate synthase component I family protein [Nitrospinota bacterium]|nr:anthranilate synthase component I family protein [Nitrospinota bacterium]